MGPAFGFGVGDFIAVATLINSIRTSLQDAGGARDEFQVLERELELLDRTLRVVKTLQGSKERESEIATFKLVALSCRHVLDGFWKNIKKYESSLSVTSRMGKVKAAGAMVQWGLSMQGDVVKLRRYIATHMGLLNTLIAAEVLKKTQESAEKADQNHKASKQLIEEQWNQTRGMILHAAEKSDENQTLAQQSLATNLEAISIVGNNVQKSEILLRGTKTIVEQVKEKLEEEVLQRIGTVVSSTDKLLVGHNEVMSLVEARLPQPDARFTWAQTPVYLEDALGRSIIIPSEYDYDMLEAVIFAKFRKGPGSEKVLSGDFELFSSYDASHIVNATTIQSTGLIPGMRISMAIVVGQYATIEGSTRCARTACKSRSFQDAEQGGKTCIICQTWFDRSSKKLCRPFRPPDHVNFRRSTKCAKLTLPPAESSAGRKHYKNIRIYISELPSLGDLQRDRYGVARNSDNKKTSKATIHPDYTHTDVPEAWLRTRGHKPTGFHTTHRFKSTAKIDPQSPNIPEEVSEHELVKNNEQASPSIVHNDEERLGDSEKDQDLARSESLKVERAVAMNIEALNNEDWLLLSRHSKILELNQLGEGGGGLVVKCILKGGKTVFAVKTLYSLEVGDSKKQRERELLFNMSCKSEWICRYYGSFDVNNGIGVSIVMEFCEGGSLDNIYQEIKRLGGRIGEKVLGKVTESVLLGLTYLHSQHIIHRDIKPANILFTKDGRVKLCDFGVSGTFGTNGDVRTQIGTSYYMSPERITGQSYNITCDVWSLGVTVLEGAQGRFPLFAIEPRLGFTDIFSAIVRGSAPKLEDEPENAKRWSENLKYFIECCLEKDVTRRASPWRMLEHPWLVDMKSRKVNMEYFIRTVWGWPEEPLDHEENGGNT